MFKRKFYITTPVYYVNNKPQLGNAYTTVAADVLARYHRMKGEETFFLTGTDEHGAKIESAARKQGRSPESLCNENVEFFKQSWKGLNVSYDKFIRTTDPQHVKAVQEVLQILYKKGFIYKGVYEGFYCQGCEQYKTENDLVDGKCPDHQTEPELMKEESYLFKLSHFQKEIKKKIEKGKIKIEPEGRKNEVLGFLKQGLKDISISRQKVQWGVPLPFDPKFTAYVWIDAFLNYLTGLGWEGDPEKISKLWPPDLQLIGKDILRVHATIWPALLLALEISLPKRIFTHGYLTLSGQKMSKSLGNVIWPEELIQKFGSDATRYLLLSSCRFGQDGDISWERLIEKYNADLANNLGNLVNRILSMMVRYKIKTLPSPEKINDFWKDLETEFDNLNFSLVLENIFGLITKTNQDIDKTKPWELADNSPKALGKLFYSWLERLRMIGLALYPFLPETSDKIIEQLGLDLGKEKQKKFKEAIKWGGLPQNIEVKEIKPLFPRLEEALKK